MDCYFIPASHSDYGFLDGQICNIQIELKTFLSLCFPKRYFFFLVIQQLEMNLFYFTFKISISKFDTKLIFHNITVEKFLLQKRSNFLEIRTGNNPEKKILEI